jgi:hypothetical protein
MGGLSNPNDANGIIRKVYTCGPTRWEKQRQDSSKMGREGSVARH